MPDDQIIRWALYVRTHSDWKKIHTKFINAQYQKYYAFLKRLLASPGGKKKYNKLMELRLKR